MCRLSIKQRSRTRELLTTNNTVMQEMYRRLLEAFGSAKPDTCLLYQDNIKDILNLVDSGNKDQAKELADLVINQLSE